MDLNRLLREARHFLRREAVLAGCDVNHGGLDARHFCRVTPLCSFVPTPPVGYFCVTDRGRATAPTRRELCPVKDHLPPHATTSNSMPKLRQSGSKCCASTPHSSRRSGRPDLAAGAQVSPVGRSDPLPPPLSIYSVNTNPHSLPNTTINAPLPRGAAFTCSACIPGIDCRVCMRTE